MLRHLAAPLLIHSKHYPLCDMSSEIDPLLPRGPSAPEISGHGFSKKEQPHAEVSYDTPSYYYHDDEEEEERTPAASSTRSALSTIIAIFTAVVFFAFVMVAPQSRRL